MSHTRPTIGDYCLCEQQGLGRTPWPALLITDDMLPVEVTKPVGYYHLVLLMKEPPEFHFAISREIHPFGDFSPDPEVARQTQGLQQAYELVLCAMESDLSPLQYWRMETRGQHQERPYPLFEQKSDYDEDMDSDSDFRRAIMFSSAAQISTRKPPLPTPSKSPPRGPRRARAQVAHGHIRDCFVPKAKSSIAPVRPRRPVFEKNDVVEGDIALSKAFVEFLVGPDPQSFLIPKNDVFSRPYFASRHHGYLRAKGDEGWSICIPALPTVDPDDFGYAADYLSNGDFGIRVIDDENRDQAIAECVAAWEVADRLGMEDLLERIVEKMQLVVPWASAEVLAFVTLVYRTSGAPLDGHRMMKDALTDYVADNYYDMLRDHGDGFTRRMRKLPELERDIHRKISERAQQRVDKEEAREWEDST